MTIYSPGDITSIPGTVTYLFNLYQTSWVTDTNNVPVYYWYGAELGSWQSPTTVEINGVSSITREWAEFGPSYRIEETYRINCKLSYFLGSGGQSSDFFTVMNAVYTGWGTLQKAVANDPTLGGNVRLSYFNTSDYEPSTDGKGMPMGCLPWTVHCAARVTTLA